MTQVIQDIDLSLARVQKVLEQGPRGLDGVSGSSTADEIITLLAAAYPDFSVTLGSDAAGDAPSAALIAQIVALGVKEKNVLYADTGADPVGNNLSIADVIMTPTSSGITMTLSAGVLSILSSVMTPTSSGITLTQSGITVLSIADSQMIATSSGITMSLSAGTLSIDDSVMTPASDNIAISLEFTDPREGVKTNLFDLGYPLLDTTLTDVTIGAAILGPDGSTMDGYRYTSTALAAWAGQTALSVPAANGALHTVSLYVRTPSDQAVSMGLGNGGSIGVTPAINSAPFIGDEPVWILWEKEYTPNTAPGCASLWLGISSNFDTGEWVEIARPYVYAGAKF